MDSVTAYIGNRETLLMLHYVGVLSLEAKDYMSENCDL